LAAALMTGPNFFLFVSHVREDRPAALEIVEELERRGVQCWVAPRDVRPGKPFDDEIVDAIEACRAMLLVFSERCNERDYIRREVTVAGESHKVIIPFRIEDAQPRRGLRMRLSDLHWIDGFISRERAIDQVVREIDPGWQQEERGRQQEERRGERQQAEEKQREADVPPFGREAIDAIAILYYLDHSELVTYNTFVDEVSRDYDRTRQDSFDVVFHRRRRSISAKPAAPPGPPYVMIQGRTAVALLSTQRAIRTDVDDLINLNRALPAGVLPFIHPS
jgi:hypothetical protein